MAEQIDLFDREVSFMDSFLNSLPKPSKADLLPSLGEEMQSPCDVHRSIPEPGGVVIENGDAATVQLLREDYLLIEAAQAILSLEILENALTVKHFRWIVMKLRDNLLEAGEEAPQNVSHGEAYAVILTCLSKRLTTLDYESALSVRPLSFVECLNTLIENMESGFVIMKQSGLEPDVFIMKDKEPVGYPERLCSLASYLIGG